MLEIDTVGQGITSDGQLLAGVTYDIIAIDSNSPVINYSALFVCFADGTHIETPDGQIPLENLKRGDLIDTIDNGLQPLRWIGRRSLHFERGPDPQKPIRFAKSSIAPGLPTRDLVVSPQHRFVLEGEEILANFGHRAVLTPAKAFLPLPGVRQMAGKRSVTYHSLFFDRHQVLKAEGVQVERFYPGPYAMLLLTSRQHSEIRGICPKLLADPVDGYGAPAWPIVGRRPVEGFLKALRRSSNRVRCISGKILESGTTTSA